MRAKCSLSRDHGFSPVAHLVSLEIPRSSVLAMLQPTVGNRLGKELRRLPMHTIKRPTWPLLKLVSGRASCSCPWSLKPLATGMLVPTRVLRHIAQGVASRTGTDHATTLSTLLQEAKVVVRGFRARAALRRRAELAFQYTVCHHPGPLWNTPEANSW